MRNSFIQPRRFGEVNLTCELGEVTCLWRHASQSPRLAVTKRNAAYVIGSHRVIVRLSEVMFRALCVAPLGFATEGGGREVENSIFPPYSVYFRF